MTTVQTEIAALEERLYEGPQSSATLTFMRVWVRKNHRWQIVAGSISH